jgi:hypothetical protein
LRTEAVEGHRHAAAERAEDHDRHAREAPIQIEEDAERDDGGDDRSGELHETGADEIPDPFRVRHDARDQDAGLGRVEIANRQAHDVRLDVLAHLGDRALRGDAEDLRVPERRRGLHERGRADGERDIRQELPPVLRHHFVHQPLGGPGRHQAGQAVDEHQRQPQREASAMLPNQPTRLFPGALGELRFLGFLRFSHGLIILWPG